MKITKIIIAVALVTAILTACGEDVDITINKVTSGFVPDTDITIVDKNDYSDTTSKAPQTSSKDTSSKNTESGQIPSQVRSKVLDIAEERHSEYKSFALYGEGVDIVGGYECYIVEVFSGSNVFLATYAIGVDHDYVAFVYDTSVEKYRIMYVDGTSIRLGAYADTLVSHGTYTNQPAGYLFNYDGEPNISKLNNTTVFTTGLWLVAIEGEVPTATLDFTSSLVRKAQEDTVMREMLEELGLVFDWAQSSELVSAMGSEFVRRPFFATYGDTEVENGAVYYGYANNGMFYKIVAFSLGESDSVGNLLNGLEFTKRVNGGAVRDQRTEATQPTWPNAYTPTPNPSDNTSSTSSSVDRPFGW